MGTTFKLRAAGIAFFMVSCATCMTTMFFTDRREEVLFWLIAAVALVLCVVGVNLFRAAEGRIRVPIGRSPRTAWSALVIGPIVGSVIALSFVPGAEDMGMTEYFASGAVLGWVAGVAILLQEKLLHKLSARKEFVGRRALDASRERERERGSDDE